jgi:Ca-activated chloride channel family protein
VEFARDPRSGELRLKRAGAAASAAEATGGESLTLRVNVSLVEINCGVRGADGKELRGLKREAFRILENGVEQKIEHFDDGSERASLALVLDDSPSVYREWNSMKRAARALAAGLAPQDEIAVVAFAAETHLLLPFTNDRTQLERAMAKVEIAGGPGSPRGSNIYQAVYLTVKELFAGRRGRKAIVLLTDGQDSGLGLGWTSSSETASGDRLTFQDVARALSAAGVEAHVVSTQPRPRAMSEAWLESRLASGSLLAEARRAGIPHYTAYLAELVRWAGGKLYFLGEIGSLEEVYRQIAERLRAQYTLGYYPAAGTRQSGWRKVRVELSGVAGARVTHRAMYYVPAH